MARVSLAARARNIRVVALDVDGVLTDGTIRYLSDGRELKVFHVTDGSGIAYLRRAGYRIAIISGRNSPATEVRARELKIDLVYQGYLRKTDAYTDLLRRCAVTDAQVCFMGDDLADLCLLRRVGLAAAPDTAVAEAKRAAHLVTRAPAGGGAVRELAEFLLKSTGRWAEIVKTYRDASFEPPRALRQSVTEYGGVKRAGGRKS